jgi:hypothetical protein
MDAPTFSEHKEAGYFSDNKSIKFFFIPPDRPQLTLALLLADERKLPIWSVTTGNIGIKIIPHQVLRLNISTPN